MRVWRRHLASIDQHYSVTYIIFGSYPYRRLLLLLPAVLHYVLHICGFGGNSRWNVINRHTTSIQSCSNNSRVTDNAEEDQAYRRLCGAYPPRRGRIQIGRKLCRLGIAIHVKPMPTPPGLSRKLWLISQRSSGQLMMGTAK